ncbi:nuclear transport factor 2 family protein [Candidatus Bipolaricaulota bacterium]|nr:nuclear transport factor 2 family protein [Candidatus Bipolaricaulota bacterium]
MGDQEDIRWVIERAYIEGIHQDQDEAKVEAGFHPEFRMLVRRDEEIVKVDPGAFLQKVKERREADPGFFEEALTYDIPLVDVEGTAAVARIELYRGGVHLFTDYQLLYRFDDGWKIVSKVFHSHT